MTHLVLREDPELTSRKAVLYETQTSDQGPAQNIQKTGTINLLLSCLNQQVLQIQKSLLLRVHIDKGSRNSRFPISPGSSNLMDIIFNLFRHCKDDDVLNLREIEALGSNARCNHDVLCAGFERLDGVLTLFLGCERLFRQDGSSMN